MYNITIDKCKKSIKSDKINQQNVTVFITQFKLSSMAQCYCQKPRNFSTINGANSSRSRWLHCQCWLHSCSFLVGSGLRNKRMCGSENKKNTQYIFTCIRLLQSFDRKLLWWMVFIKLTSINKQLRSVTFKSAVKTLTVK